MKEDNRINEILMKWNGRGNNASADGHKKDIARFLQYIDKRIEAADIPTEEKDLLREMIVNDIFPHCAN